MLHIEPCPHCGVLLGQRQIRRHLKFYNPTNDLESDSDSNLAIHMDLAADYDLESLPGSDISNQSNIIAGVVGAPVHNGMDVAGDPGVQGQSRIVIETFICSTHDPWIYNPQLQFRKLAFLTYLCMTMNQILVSIVVLQVASCVLTPFFQNLYHYTEILL
jgi:hypothetical protein